MANPIDIPRLRALLVAGRIAGQFGTMLDALNELEALRAERNVLRTQLALGPWPDNEASDLPRRDQILDEATAAMTPEQLREEYGCAMLNWTSAQQLWERAKKERDDARGDCAAFTDAINGWCREVGASEATSSRMADVREALNRVGYTANGLRVERDALRRVLAQAVHALRLATMDIDAEPCPAPCGLCTVKRAADEAVAAAAILGVRAEEP